MRDADRPFALPHAEIDWSADDEPFSSRFGDHYASRAGALAESRLVFLDANRLGERWSGLRSGDRFTLGETGFGTGSNFLLAWELWQRLAPAAARLHYLAVEAHPLHPDDLARALTRHPPLTALSEPLLAAYPAAIPGIHRLELHAGTSPVTLDLLFGDAEAMLAQLCTRQGFAIDGWFLDGFAPQRNPGMWHDGLYRQLARLSRPGTTFGTYTAAGAVRRGLSDAGFRVERASGFGHKRERLLGHFVAATAPVVEPGPPWSWLPPARHAATASAPVAVIGAGIAGSSTAQALARRGIEVALFDSENGAGRAASGNPQAVLYSKLSAHATPQSRFALHSYLHALRFYQALEQQRSAEQATLLHGCGLLQLATQAATRQRLLDIAHRSGLPTTLVRWVDAAEASQLAGVALAQGGLLFPTGGWLTPTALCQQLSSHPRIRCHFGTAVTQLRHDAEHGSWQLLDGDGHCLLRTATVVISAGAASTRFEPLAALPIKPIGGQVSQLPVSSASRSLQLVLCGEGYLAPADQAAHTFGASYRLHDDDGLPSIDDHRRNLAMLQQEFPTFHQQLADEQLDPARLAGRYGIRATTPDRLPLVGPVTAGAQPIRHLPGLYINAGHGSRGFVQAPLCAELIAALVSGDSLPVESAVMTALNPARFAVRALKHRKPQS
ncbi:MAG TPA: bifunctional tRNA (5-methylaminomethyl-2-thiouridine)(34)-methyltransferase MnmD/FAD-dependent 5-carboxymethylaminomethyl-2-thiouridine(34) oxidoreductase MnmC [Pseudomonadales bacterium]|nr:bifunctional tRNA (5-methylaminomethyl-2-thiouridine)(34)-methyltransferase MnmD/FAD-dependent 5-carboxymethylaminomethyl-2-thiouridine(34) oxidoreductase MnmC [Pseudomonadales bacterium]